MRQPFSVFHPPTFPYLRYNLSRPAYRTFRTEKLSCEASRGRIEVAALTDGTKDILGGWVDRHGHALPLGFGRRGCRPTAVRHVRNGKDEHALFRNVPNSRLA